MRFPASACFSSVLVLALGSAAAVAQEEKPAAPLVTPANGRSIKLEGQLQVQVASTSVDSAVGWDADLRRMRFTVLGDAGNGFSGALQLEFGQNRVRIRDAVIDYEVSPRFTLRGGQFKIPFNGIEMTSSKRLLMVERDSRIRGLDAETTSGFLADAHLSARNRGFMGVFEINERLVLQAGGWLGSGENSDDNDGKEVAARLEFTVVPATDEAPRPLVVGAAAVANGYFGGPRDTVQISGSDTLLVDEPEYASAFEGWVEFGKYLLPGPHLAGNVVAGDNPTEFHAANGGLEFESFLGFQGWGEYLFETGGDILTGVAPAFRADRFDPNTDTDEDANLLLTPGLNLYLGKNVKTQLNYDILVPEGETRETESAFRFQTQVLF